MEPHRVCGVEFSHRQLYQAADYRLDVLLKENTDNDAYSDQLSLFADEPDGTENWMIDPVTHETIPRPLREYQPVDYRRVQENG